VNDFDEILDQGNIPEPPTEAYKAAVQRLDGVVRQAMILSRRCGGLSAASNRHFYASVLFTTVVVRSISLLQIAPLSSWAQKVIEHWDYASASVIARTLLEIRLCFYYMCIDPCSDAEWQCRWETMNLNDCAHRIKIFEATGVTEQVNALQLVMEELAARIGANAHFQSLDRGQQKNILRGTVTYLEPQENIAEKAGIAKTDFRFFHVFFSTHVHGLPMSFYRVGEERGRGLPTPAESGYTAMCLELAASLVAACHAELEGLFHDALVLRELSRETGFETHQVEPQTDALVAGIGKGEVRTVHDDQHMRIDAVGRPNGEVSLVYFEPLMREKVLRMQATPEGEHIAFVDPVYWIIDVNDEPVTDRLLDELIQADHAYSVDLARRRLRFKVPIEALRQAREAMAESIKSEPQLPGSGNQLHAGRTSGWRQAIRRLHEGLRRFLGHHR
jgi:hypothetical protein